jgi:hypothetical protein
MLEELQKQITFDVDIEKGTKSHQFNFPALSCSKEVLISGSVISARDIIRRER